MKKLSLLFAVALLISSTFSSCKKDDDDGPKYSALTPEQHKTEIEDEGVEFVQNISAVADLQLYDVITELEDLMDIDDPMAGSPALSIPLNRILAVKDSPASTIDLKAFKVEGDESISANFAEIAGVYSFNTSTQQWDLASSTTQLIFNFPLSNGQQASVGIETFELTTASNQDVDGFIVEMPKDIYMSIRLDGVVLCSYSVTGEYYSDDMPKLLEETITLEGFNATSTLDLTNKSVLKISNSLKYEDTFIIGNGVEINGNMNYDDLIAEIEALEEEGNPLEQEVLNSANAYFQIGNIKAEGILNVKGLISDIENTSFEGLTEEEAEAKQLAIMNKNIKLYIKYADSDEIIAYGEIYMSEYRDEYYYNGTYYVDVYTEPAVRMLFADGSAMSDDYFDNGFGNMIDEINDLITDMNTNYGMDLEPIQ